MVMKIKKDTKATVFMVAVVIIIVYIMLWLTYPRNVEQPLPAPLDTGTATNSK